MHRGRVLAGKSEARYGQLQVSIGGFDNGREYWYRYRTDAHRVQRLVQAQYQLIEGLIIILSGDGGARYSASRPEKDRCAILARPVRDRRAAKSDEALSRGIQAASAIRQRACRRRR